MYRLFIEKTGHSYVRISLQRKDKRWKVQERQYCESSNKARYGYIVQYYMKKYNMQEINVIDTRYDYKDVSWVGAIINELKISIEFFIWEKRFENVKKQAIFLHKQSGLTKHTRTKFWIMTNWKGDPMLMNSRAKDDFKRKKIYSSKVDAIAMNNECIWCTDALYV